MQKNRFISILLALLMLQSIFFISVSAEGETTSYEWEIKFLQTIGGIAQKYDAVKNVTRSEFCKMTAEILHPDMTISKAGKGESLFQDVTGETKSADYIKFCKELGYISGDGENRFYPEREITGYEAAVILINALQYTRLAQAKGGYPTGYLSTAYEIGLTKGVSVNSGTVSGGAAAKLFYNALFADLVVVGQVSEAHIGLTVDSDSNLLKERYHIEEYDAQVVDNGITSLTGESIHESQYIVLRLPDGNMLKVFDEKEQCAGYLGSRLKIYIHNNQEQDRRELVLFSIHTSSQEITLQASDILSMTETQVRYEKEKDSGKELKLSFTAGGPVMILNGIQLISYEMEAVLPKEGFLRLIDLERDGRYDIVDIISFNCYGSVDDMGATRNIVVDDIKESILCKVNPRMRIRLDEEEADYRLILSDAYPTMDDVPLDSVISVAESPEPVDGKKFYYLVVHDERIEGAVEGIDTTEGEILIGGKGYPVSDSLLSIKPNLLGTLSMDKEITAYLDCFGKIAYIESGASGKNYAYLIGAEAERSLEEEVKIKIFLPEEGVKVLPLRASVTIDGVSYTGLDSQLEALARRPAEYSQIKGGPSAVEYLSKPVILKKNAEGYVTEIDTEYPNYPTGQTGESVYDTMTPIRYSEQEVEDSDTLKAGLRTPRTSSFSVRTNSMDGRYFVTGNTMILNVPDIDTFGISDYTAFGTGTTTYQFQKEMIDLYENKKTEDQYRVLGVGDFVADSKLDMQAYDVDPVTGVAGLVVVRGNADIILTQDWSAPMAVFLKKTQFYHEESGEFGTRLYYTEDGKTEKSASVVYDTLPFYYRYLIEGCGEEETAFRKKIPALQKGDIIRVFARTGQLFHIERVANLQDKLSSSVGMAYYPYNANAPYVNGSGRNDGFPFYLNFSKVGIDGTYVVGAAVVKDKQGTQLSVYVPKDTVGSISPGDPATYTELFIKAGSLPIVVVTIQKDGNIKVANGSTEDIISKKQFSGEEGFQKASRILYCHRLMSFYQIVVINDETV